MRVFGEFQLMFNQFNKKLPQQTSNFTKKDNFASEIRQNGEFLGTGIVRVFE